MTPSRIALVVALGLSLASLFWVVACSKTADPTPAAPAPAATAPAPTAAAAPASAPAASEPAPPAAPGAPAEPAAPAEGAGGTGVKVGAVTQVNRAVVAKTFEEVYCAQKLGKKSDEILAIYAANGFTTPRDWTEAWTRTGDDPAWQEELARRIRDARCR